MKDGIKKQVTRDGACDSFSTEYVRNCVSNSSEDDIQKLLKTCSCHQVPYSTKEAHYNVEPPSLRMTESRGLSS